MSEQQQSAAGGAESNLFECMEGKDFNPVDWVNRLVAAASLQPANDEADDALLNAVRSAQTRLQTRSQELSRDAERLMERLLSLGPRTVQELDRVERDAQALKQDLKRLQDESRASTAGGMGPFQTLKSLDIIKTNLERCVQVLQETGSWNVLVREMESYFASRNLGEVASRLNTMKQSAAALAVFPGSDERQEMLERMEQRLESLVRPGLATALEQADSDRDLLKQSVVVFTKLGRREALLNDLAASRGRLLFAECWNAKDESFAKFTDRVFARLRQVELPLCEYVFAGVGADGPGGDLQAVSDALGAILQSCFDSVTPQLVSALTNKQCERYVAAHLAAEQFALDVTNSLLRPASPPVQSAVSLAILHPFRTLDTKYLEWEAAELVQTLQAEVAKLAAGGGGGASTLGPSVRDRLQLEMDPRDALDMLSEACLSRCHRIKVPRAFVPICKMYYSHLTTAKVSQPSIKATTTGAGSKLEPRDRLHTLCQLKQRFETCIAERCGVAATSAEEDVAKVQRKLDQLIQEAKSLLFDSFLNPALALLDLAVLGEADSVTKMVDHLYALIPQLEFEYCTRDFLADLAVLGRRERQDLEAVLGKRAIPYSSTANTAAAGGGEEDIPRQVSASWLECIARAMCTGLVLRVVKLKSISDSLAAKLGADTDMLEKNAGSVLSPGDRWDPALGVCRVVLSAEPGLTYLKLGDPKAHLDSRYLAEGEEHADDALKALEHLLVGLRTRRVD